MSDILLDAAKGFEQIVQLVEAGNPVVIVGTVVVGMIVLLVVMAAAGAFSSSAAPADGNNNNNNGKKKNKKKKPKKNPSSAKQQQQPKKKKSQPAAPAAPAAPAPAAAAPVAAGKKKKKKKKASAAAAAPAPAAAPPQEEAEAKTDNKKSQKPKVSQEDRIRKKMAAAARKEAESGSGDSGGGWSTASNKKRNKGGAKKQVAAAASSSSAAANPALATVEVKVEVEGRKIGNIIGSGGETMRAIEEKSGAKIDIPRRSGGGDEAGGKPKRAAGTVSVSITGTRDACKMAKRAIKDLCSKGYSSLLSTGDFVEAAMTVPARSIPEIFGSGGSVIRVIQSSCDVRVHVPETPGQQQGPAPTTRKITIAGSREGASKAKDIVTAIVKFHHHPVTHPGITHVDISLTQASDVGTIIGKGGSQIKHIQGNTKTRVYTNDAQKVLVVGPQAGVALAQKMIQKILADAGEAREQMANGGVTGGGPVDPDDAWGGAFEDEPEEDLWATPSSTMTIQLPSHGSAD